MPKIHVLDKAVAELIAAGEVVERPASIAKELIENSIDAGATAVTVEIEGGGVSLLRVTDNGSGIARKDIPTAFLRHATSKVATQTDLDAILTLGFRGEALASIAAMCKVELTSKTADEDEGTTCYIEGGGEPQIMAAGCPTGTIISVRDVFYNTPARMKFLKKDVGEGNAISQVAEKCALSHPEIAFKFVRDGKTRLQTSGSGDLLAVIRAIYGKEFADTMLPVSHQMPEEGISVSGYTTNPAGAKASRTYQNFFLNSRYVRSRTAMAALEEGYKTFIGSGKYPGCVLNIEIAPGLVDVNVHPAKIEVRFVNERPVFHCVYFGVKSALTLHRTGQVLTEAREQENLPEPTGAPSVVTPKAPAAKATERMTSEEFKVRFAEEVSDGLFSKRISFGASSPDIYVPAGEKNPGVPTGYSAKSPGSDKIPPKEYSKIFLEDAGKSTDLVTDIKNQDRFSEIQQEEDVSVQVPLEQAPPRVIGEYSGTYILLERDGDLVIVDKHAAHERIIYEQLKESIAYGNRQVLLTPMNITLAGEEHGVLVENEEKLLSLGFLAEDFGGNTVVVREVPVELGERDVAFILSDIASKLLAGKQDITPNALDRLYYSIACKSAVRAKDKNNLPELAAIVEKLKQNPDITHCPHGRPVQVTMSAYEVEKLFGRHG